MSARIARGGGRAAPSRGRPRARNAPSRGRGKAKSQSLLESFGFAPGTARAIWRWTTGGMIFALVAAAIIAFRLPQLAGLAVGEGVGKAGFTLRQVEITGNQRVSRLDIYNVAFNQPSMAMPLIDLAATRARIMQFGWIREARVSRRFPDTLVVQVIERTPAAIWQNGGRLQLIDADGVVLEPVRVESMPDLPLLIGAGANRHIADLATLLEAAPRLRPQVHDASWVGDRRWDIRFTSGETLTLPEGADEAGRAIQRFALMDQQDSLLGRGFARIDMRDPRRAYVRISREPGATVPRLSPPTTPPMTAQDLARTI